MHALCLASEAFLARLLVFCFWPSERSHTFVETPDKVSIQTLQHSIASNGRSEVLRRVLSIAVKLAEKEQ
jgi:hypothetical protein